MLYFAKWTNKKNMKNSIKHFTGSCEFFAGAAEVWQIPKSSLPEFAFIGRSNVGKSSLINTLTGRKSLARVSQNPGCTRQINFFKVSDILSLVDLPGYGYAKISNAARNTWDSLIHEYLRGRVQLKRVFLLIDSRHAIKDIDLKTMAFLDEYGISYQIVLTKVDKSNILPSIVADLATISVKHSACHPAIIQTSSLLKSGIDTLQEEIIALL
jgi:GTP-binding protein